MTHHNGNGGAFSAHRENIPIVGQAFTLKGWYPTVLITCNCEAKEPVMIVGTKNASQCKACRKAYQIVSIDFDSRKDKFNVNLAMMVPRDEPAAEKPAPAPVQ